MTFSEQLSADIALIEPALEGYLRARRMRATTAFSRRRNTPRWRAASACVR